MSSSKRKRPISLHDVIFGSTGFPLILVAIFYAVDNWIRSPTAVAHPLNLLGIVFVLAGVALSSWCFTVVRTLSHEPVLVSWGPWAHVRHPIYLAGLLINLGITLIIGTLLLIVQFVGHTLLEIFGAPLEERSLRKSMPEYEEYAKRVPAWIPRIRLGEK